MARQHRAPWWALIGSGVVGALVAGLVIVMTTGDGSAVRAAAAERPAAATSSQSSPAPAATSSEPPRPPASPQPAEELPLVSFIGDSWTEGAGATGRRGYAHLVGEELRWPHLVLGVGGTGYTVIGGRSPYAQRIDEALSVDPDVVVVQGSLNERNNPVELLGPAARETLSALRAAADDDTDILVIGASYNPGTPDATIDAINAAVGDAARSAGVRFVDPSAANWTDPADPGVWADPIHPNDAGHRLIADHVAQLLRQMVEA